MKIDEIEEKYRKQRDGHWRRILFWSISKGKRPQDHVRNDIPLADRRLVVEVLATGNRHMGYMGYASCRICSKLLGTSDMEGYGFIWPQEAEHYLLEHGVWTPGCTALLNVLKKKS